MRVRVMLAEITVLGVVGGTLAFKAKSPSPPYCFVNTTATIICTAALLAGSTIAAENTIHYVTSNILLCKGSHGCTVPGVSKIE